MHSTEPDYYATLGLDRDCTEAQIRSAYRLLAKQLHPDVNPGVPEALERTRRLNAAHEVLSDPERRHAYDAGREAARKRAERSGARGGSRNVSQDVHLRLVEFLSGATLEVCVNDPVNEGRIEIYQLEVPRGTAPGTRFKIERDACAGRGVLTVRVKARPDFRFKVRGSDLRCDLRIPAKKAAQGGVEMLTGVDGTRVRVEVPRNAARGELVRVAGEGLPRVRGGRGDLLVRLVYRPEIRVRRLARG